MSIDTFSPEAERAFRDAFRAAVLEGRGVLEDDTADIGELVEAAYQARGCEFSRAETDPVVTARLRGRHHALAFLRNLWVAHEQWQPEVAQWYSKVVTWAESPCDKFTPPPFHERMLASGDTTPEFTEENVGCVNGPQFVGGLWQPFPLQCLPEPLRSFTKSAAKALNSDPAYVAGALLVSVAAAIGTTRRLCVKRGWYEFPILWIALVGKSGCGKSPALSLATSPIKRHQHAAAIAHRQQLEAEAQCNLAGIKRRDEPEPKMPCVYLEDTTVEALIDRLVDNPRGLVVIRDELAAWVDGMNSYKGGKGADESTWLSFFDGREAKHDRKTAKRTTLFVPRAAVSLIGGIQPGVLRECLTHRRSESGLTARLLLIYPPETVQKWSDAEVDSSLVEAVNNLIDRLYSQLEFDESGGPETITLGEVARQLFIDHHDAIKRIQADASDQERAVLNKSVAITARVALCLHLVRVATFDVNLDNPKEVDESTMADAIQLTQWLTYETLRVSRTIPEPAEARREREILDLVARLQREGKPTTVRELMRHARYWKSPEEAEAELLRLSTNCKGHWITTAPGPKGGRPASEFRIGPKP